MTVELYPDLFNDVFGPVMQPGSSSHTAGPCRLGYMANRLLNDEVCMISVILDPGGSFAGAFGIMAEDSAMLAGAMGMLPDDPRLFSAARLADEAGICHSFEFSPMTESRHPNAMKFVLTGRSGKTITLVGDSTGGGMVETRVVEGFSYRFKGDAWLLMVFDPDGVLGPEEADRIRTSLPGLTGAGVTKNNGQSMHYFKTADEPPLDVVRKLAPGLRTETMAPVLPVLTRPDRGPQLFDTMTRWRGAAEERGLTLWETAVQYEMNASGWTFAQVVAYMRGVAAKMHRQTRAAYEEGAAVPETPFRKNLAAGWDRHMATENRLTGSLTANTIRWAYGAGAGIPGVETVPGPMGSGGGYLYAALSAVMEDRGLTDDDLLRGLFVAGGVGVIAFSRTEPTGECIGCTGECGICGAMAAAGIAEMVYGSPQQVENAASLSLQSSIGLPCDPIPGGKGQPCKSRILAATCMAHVFADLALAGHDAVLPLHEAIDVADAVGRQLSPDLLCTSRGGAAVTPTAMEHGRSFREWYDCTVKEGLPRPPGNLI